MYNLWKCWSVQGIAVKIDSAIQQANIENKIESQNSVITLECFYVLLYICLDEFSVFSLHFNSWNSPAKSMQNQQQSKLARISMKQVTMASQICLEQKMAISNLSHC